MAFDRSDISIIEQLQGAADSGTPDREVRALRRKTLATLRWFAIVGQTVAVVGAQAVLGVDLPVAACAGVIAIAVFYNTASQLATDGGRRLKEQDARLTLFFDLFQLSALLCLTGGLGNPFALFLLGPVTIAASILSLRTSLMLAFGTVCAATILLFAAPPLSLRDGTSLAPPEVIQYGVWTAIAAGVGFMAVYARRVANESFNMSAALGAAQAALEREQRISSIGALAAATAHELGTPLATIKLVAGELRSELRERSDLPPELAEDAELIAEQARRCRDILHSLSRVTTPEDAHLRTAPIMAVIEEAAAPHRDRRARLVLRMDGALATPDDPGGEQPAIPRSPEFIQGVRNLIQNAVDFAGSTVWVDVETSDDTIAVIIGDDGAGFSDEILEELGEPFATTRGGGQNRDGYSGMGLGVFIAKTLLERIGATLTFGNHESGRDGGRDSIGRRARDADAPALPKELAQPTGAIVRAEWLRARLEAPGAVPPRPRAEQRDADTGPAAVEAPSEPRESSV